MSATAPSHGHPDKTSSKPQEEVKDSTASHPHSSKPDPTSTSSVQDAQGRLAASSTTSSAKLSSLQMRLKKGLRQYPDFPTKGVLFEDIMPIFADVKLHEALIDAFELHIMDTFGKQGKPDVIVGLDARGFLFGPSLALRLGAAFVPVRKTGKLPGETVTASFKKEYGEDFFQMQKGVIKEGQRVIIVDDIIATGMIFRIHFLLSC